MMDLLDASPPLGDFYLPTRNGAALRSGSHDAGSESWLRLPDAPGYGIARYDMPQDADTRDCNWARRCAACHLAVVLPYTLGLLKLDMTGAGGWYQQADLCQTCTAKLTGDIQRSIDTPAHTTPAMLTQGALPL